MKNYCLKFPFPKMLQFKKITIGLGLKIILTTNSATNGKDLSSPLYRFDSDHRITLFKSDCSFKI